MAKTNKVLAVFGNVAFYGQERANIQVFSTLKEENYNFILAVNDIGFHWNLQPEIEKRGFEYKKIRYTWNFSKRLSFKLWKSYIINIPKSNFQLYRLIKKNKPEFIHVCNDTHVMSLLPALFLTKVKIIYRLGDKPSGHLSPVHKWVWKYLIIRRVDHFVCISKFIKDELLKLNCGANKISTIYNFPPLRAEKFDPVIPERDKNVLTFTFIGQISRDKGIDLLIKAFLKFSATHKNCRLLVAGDLQHNRDLTETLKKEVSSSPNSKEIQFLGSVTNINQLLKITDINIIPSVVDEALSNVIVEAKSNSVPSIVFPSGGLPELVAHKKNGYITTEKNVKDLVLAMGYYIEHPEKANFHGKAAFNSLKEHQIDYNSYKKKWLQVYG